MSMYREAYRGEREPFTSADQNEQHNRAHPNQRFLPDRGSKGERGRKISDRLPDE